VGHQKIETTTVYTKVPDGAMRRAAAASSLVLGGR
jgi:site-specific recombinase XerD